jgi:hypothetical protein
LAFYLHYLYQLALMLTFWLLQVVEVEAVQHPAQSVAAAAAADSSNSHHKEFCSSLTR